VYQDLAATLRLQDESKLEWSAGRADAEAERALFARLTGDALGVFLALLAVVHHRLDVDLSAMPPAVYARFQALSREVTALLGALADQVDDRAQPITPGLGPLLASASDAVHDAGPALDPTMQGHLRVRLAVYGDLVSRLTQLAHDIEAPVVVASSSASSP
jgi:hypothetical protein